MSAMPSTALALTVAASAPASVAEDLGRLVLWVVVPAAILGTAAAAMIKWTVLARPRFREHRPGIQAFVWIGLADMVAWAVLWPALLVVRIRGLSSGRGLWVAALLMVVALGYIANRYGFARAFHPKVAGSVRGTLLAELFTILMPILSVAFGFGIFWLLGMLGV